MSNTFVTSPVAKASLQGAAISLLSNVIAQWISANKKQEPLRLDITQIIHWFLFSLIITPPNFQWQMYLEDILPAYIRPKPASKKLTEKQEKANSLVDRAGAEELKFSWMNTVKKLALDQLVGGPVNTVLYLAIFAGFQGMGLAEAFRYTQDKFVEVTIAGLKFWPAVAVISFAFIPPAQRMVFAGLAGLVWNVVLSLATMA